MSEIQPAVIIGILGIAVLAISATLTIKGRSGTDWGFVALLLIITSCSKA